MELPRTASLRVGLEPLKDRAAERLFAAAIAEWPCAPPVLAHDENGTLLIASDGSSFEGVGGFAIVTCEPEAVFVSGHDAEDQSAFRQEALAMLTLFRGLRQLSSTCLGDVCMVYDCEAVAAGIRCPAASSLPAIFDEIACAKAELSSNGLNFNVVWVPWHGKHATWQAPDGLESAACRLLNDKADAAANRARENRWHSVRRKWHEGHCVAVNWELAAIRAAAGASDMLGEALDAAAVFPAAADGGGCAQWQLGERRAVTD